MLRYLRPGLRLKRYLLIVIGGMLVFAIGFALVLTVELNPRQALWRLWMRIISSTMPERMPVLLGVLLLLIGIWLVANGTRRLIRSFTRLANPNMSGHQLMEAMLERGTPHQRVRIVGMGGGTGLSTLLRGLKAYPLDITAVVTVSDDGGSSGRLRRSLDMPPPGDIRACLVALAETEPLMERLFQHRFGGDGARNQETAHDLDGHALGNLIIAGLSEMTGDFQAAVAEASRVLAVRGTVLPSADRGLVLAATMRDGRIVTGETAITAHKGTIATIALDTPDVAPLPAVIEAIHNADVIVVGPGSVYTSLLPNLIIPGMVEAIADSPALKFFVCNVMTQPGESDGFTAARHLEAVLEHLPGGNPFQYVVVNTRRPAENVLALYAEKDQQFVEPDLERVRALGSIPVTADLLADTSLARHDPEQLARCILERVAVDAQTPDVLRKRR